MTLLNIVFRCAKRICNIFQRRSFTEITNRKNALEYSFKTEVFSRFDRYVYLEESLVGVLLNIDQVGNIDDFFDLSEVLAQKGVIRN